MTDFTLSEAEKKLLTTEVLGECWLSNQECIDSYASNREYDTDQDRTDLAKKLGEMEKWSGFLEFAKKESGYLPWYDFTYYLMVESPERFCKMVVEWRGGEKK